jgi:glycine/serine hydroxymethyltransferase
MREPEMDQVGDFIARVLASPEDDRVLGIVKDDVMKLCKRFPLYPELQ